jgi:hypothetical protein
MRRVRSRREFLVTAGIGAAALAAGCGLDAERDPATPGDEARPDTTGSREPAARVAPSAAPPPAPTPPPTPTPTPTPRPAGHEVRGLLPDTPWEAVASIRSTGLPGPTLVVLGGVHGNEPGGWLASDEVAAWEPAAGVLAVVPRANVLAIARFVRLIEGEGDLNRQYPGDRESDNPMSRLAAEITGIARELRAEMLLDLHESWAFYADREAAGFVNRAQAGTAFLGQTITTGVGPRAQVATELASMVNESIALEREHFIPRVGWSLDGSGSGGPVAASRGTSSLALGAHVGGLTPVLVEAGQQGQHLGRRTELHLMVVRATMDLLAM